jgi:ferrous iron transport protein B
MTIALAGQPNVGKSTVYNHLTGEAQYVSNWPGKTSESRMGSIQFQGEDIRLVDLPGTYSLSANSVEEQIARQYIIEEKPDALVVVLDAVTLERNLYLAAELLSLPVPLVLAINRIDLAASQGIHIETEKLEAALHVPVVELIAQQGKGIEKALSAAVQTARHPEIWQPNRPAIRPDHQAVLSEVEKLIEKQVPAPYPADWVALKLLEGDKLITEKVKAAMGAGWEQVHALLLQHDDAFFAVASGRYEWISHLVEAAVTRPKAGMLTKTDKIDRYATDSLWGVAILILVMAALFGFTFAIGIPLQTWLETHLVQGFGAWVASLMAAAPPWLESLVVKGLIGGVGTVLTLLPILILFFFGMGLLEDSGYMARAAFVTDRLMHAFGLHGKSFLPLSFSVGCNVPAVMESRVIEDPKARLITILLTPFIPCFPRLSVIVVLAPIFFGKDAFLISILLFSLPLILLAASGKVLHEVLQKGQHNAFIMELPLYQMPKPGAIFKSLWGRIVDFLHGAATIILFVSVGLWALSYFPGGEIGSSYLALWGQRLDPLSHVLGLDWQMSVALITSMLRSENTLSTLSVLYGVGPQLSLSQAVGSHLMPAAGLAFLAMQILFIPCIATIAAIRTETKSWGWTIGYVVIRLLTSLGVGALIFQFCRLIQLGV